MFSIGLNNYDGHSVVVFPPVKSQEDFNRVMAMSGFSCSLVVPEVIAAMEANPSMFPRESVEAVKVIEAGKPVIFAEASIVKEMDQRLVKAMIDHEVGHIVNDHFNQPDEDYNFNGVSVSDRKEIEADAYSASINGASVVWCAIKEVVNCYDKIAISLGMVPNEDNLEKIMVHPSNIARKHALGM